MERPPGARVLLVRVNVRKVTDFLSLFMFELSLLIYNDTYMIMVGCPWCVGVVCGVVCVRLCGG